MWNWSLFLWTLWKKIQADENGCKYILFRIDIYFSECFLAVEIDEKGHTDREIIFEEKRQKALEKKLGCKFIRINASNSKNSYDLDYEVGNIEAAFIDEFKNKKIKELEKKINKRKRNERETRKRNERETRKRNERSERESRKRNEREIRKEIKSRK